MILTGKTLDQYLLENLKNHPERLELVMVMSNLATIGKLISARTNRAGLADIRGMAGSTNIQDETQAKLDIYANELCKTYLASSGLFAALASEEEDTVVDLGSPEAPYIIAFDPLDGSSNIDVNVSTGTIFSVHKRLDNIPTSDERQFLQAGKDQVLAGYILYGTSTMLVFSWGDGVHEFTLDVDLGEFMLSNDHLMMPTDCPYYSVNEGYTNFMAKVDQAYVGRLKSEIGRLRWIGSFVADFHRNLLKGGVFFYPAVDTSGGTQYKAKLRLNYEAKPIAYLMEQAGGSASTGSEAIVEVVPTSLHQRVPVIIGNKDLVTSYKETS